MNRKRKIIIAISISLIIIGIFVVLTTTKSNKHIKDINVSFENISVKPYQLVVGKAILELKVPTDFRLTGGYSTDTRDRKIFENDIRKYKITADFVSPSDQSKESSAEEYIEEWLEVTNEYEDNYTSTNIENITIAGNNFKYAFCKYKNDFGEYCELITALDLPNGYMYQLKIDTEADRLNELDSYEKIFDTVKYFMNINVKQSEYIENEKNELLIDEISVKYNIPEGFNNGSASFDTNKYKITYIGTYNDSVADVTLYRNISYKILEEDKEIQNVNELISEWLKEEQGEDNYKSSQIETIDISGIKFSSAMREYVFNNVYHGLTYYYDIKCAGILPNGFYLEIEIRNSSDEYNMIDYIDIFEKAKSFMKISINQ